MTRDAELRYTPSNQAVATFTQKKNVFCFVLCSLIRTFELRSKVLSFEKVQINLAFCSLIRTFVAILH